MFNFKTKAIIFNNPNNPLGKVYRRHEMEQIANLCKKHNVLMISDEVYEHMVKNQTIFRWHIIYIGFLWNIKIYFVPVKNIQFLSFYSYNLFAGIWQERDDSHGFFAWHVGTNNNHWFSWKVVFRHWLETRMGNSTRIPIKELPSMPSQFYQFMSNASSRSAC